MKRIISVVFAVLFLMVLLPYSIVDAAQTEKSNNIIYLENGDHITVEIFEIETRSPSTKTGSKVYVYRNSAGQEGWRITLNGTFTYTGTSSTCITVSSSASITDNNWYVVDNVVYRSGNTATAEYTMGKKLLGVTIGKEDFEVNLSCDANGNLS